MNFDGIQKSAKRQSKTLKKSFPRIRNVRVVSRSLDMVLPNFRKGFFYAEEKLKFITPLWVPAPVAFWRKFLKKAKIVFHHSYRFFQGYFKRFKGRRRHLFLDLYKTPVGIAIFFLMMAAFAGGGILVWTTRNSAAQDPSNVGQVLGAQTTAPSFVGPVIAAEPVNFDDFANTSVRLLNDYLQGPATEEQLTARRESLKKYLEYRRSPFAEDPAALDTLVHVPHMKIILEVAFAESTLGKKCVDNNCSNIGSAPGRPYWHQYKSLSNWILDFNRLLDKRYKDWTLKQMCGVYVQPCTDSWLLATGTVRQELKDWNID